MTERAIPETEIDALEAAARNATDYKGTRENIAYIAAASPDVILKLIAELRSLKAGWISVEQELPPDRQEVLVYNELHHYAIDWLKGNEWAGDQPYSVTHWRPLPTAPGEAIAEGQPTEGTHDHCNCYRLHGRKCCICDSEPEPWEIQCGAQDPDGWCCGLSTGHAGDHDFHTSVWGDVFKPEPVAEDGGTKPLDVEKIRTFVHKVISGGASRAYFEREGSEILRELTLSENNPRIADCSYCGTTIWAKQGYMQEDGDTCHIQCKLIRATEKATLTLCAKAMCEMCERDLELKLTKNKSYWHFGSASGWIGCKASPIWEKVKR